MMSKAGWNPLPGVSRSNVAYLKRFNDRKPFLKAAILYLLLSAAALAALIYFVVGR